MFKWTADRSDNWVVRFPSPSQPPHDEPTVQPPGPEQVRRRRSLRPVLLLLAAALAIGTSCQPAPGTPGGPVSGSSFTFTGSGWGHGVGMSQWGARGMAEAGRTHAQILTTYYSGATLETRPVSDGLRVLVAERRNTMTLVTTGPTTFDGVGNVGAGASVTLTRTGNQILLSGALDRTVNGPLTVRQAGNPLTIVENGLGYRYGQLVVNIDPNGGLRSVVAGLTMQQYLYGLGEMPASWPQQALRAQAVAARTFAQKKRDSRVGSGLDHDLLSTVLDQAYTGTKFEDSRWNSAVDATAGQVLTYRGGLIDAVYHSSSGGHTESSEQVWVAKVDYLRGRPDGFDAVAGNPHNSWSRTYTGAQLGDWFGLGTVTSIEVRGPLGVSGRVDKSVIRLVGTNGSKDVLGASFRSTVNARAGASGQLMSTKFTVTGVGAPAASGPPKGTFATASAEGRRIVVTGTASDPDGVPTVRVVSTMGSQRAVRDVKPSGGSYRVTWEGAPGTRQVCVSILDVPTGAATSLGCRDVVVK